MEDINLISPVFNSYKDGNNKQASGGSSSSDQSHHLQITKTESIANHLLPLNSNHSDKSEDMIYQGSNAEYIVSKIDGSEIEEKEYLTLAVPTLQLQFPRNQLTDSTLSSSDLEKLNHDELNYIEEELNAKGLSAIKIPKTLYDMFYIAFRVNMVAKILEQGVCCELVKSLERFQYPRAEVSIFSEDLCVQNETIHEEFLTINQNQKISKIDFELNQYILNFLKKSRVESKKPFQKEIAFLVDWLWATLSKVSEGPVGDAIDRLYSGGGLFKCRKGHSNQSVFRMLRNFRDDKMFNILKRAIFQEHVQKASVYTLYRGGSLLEDSVEDKPTRRNYKPVHSISYGQGLFSSCEGDIGGAGAIPLEYIRLSGQGYALIIDKNDFYQGRAKNFFVIPPAQRTARFRLHGEFTHARSLVYSVPDEKVSGIQNTPLKKAPFIVTKGNFESTKDFEQGLNSYLTEHGSVLSTVPS